MRKTICDYCGEEIDENKERNIDFTMTFLGGFAEICKKCRKKAEKVDEEFNAECKEHKNRLIQKYKNKLNLGGKYNE